MKLFFALLMNFVFGTCTKERYVLVFFIFHMIQNQIFQFWKLQIHFFQDIKIADTLHFSPGMREIISRVVTLTFCHKLSSLWLS